MIVGATIYLGAAFLGPLLGTAIGTRTGGRGSAGLGGALAAGYAVAIVLVWCNIYAGTLSGAVVAFAIARWLSKGDIFPTLAGFLGALVGAPVGFFLVAWVYHLNNPSRGCMDALGAIPWIPIQFLGFIVGAAAGSCVPEGLVQIWNMVWNTWQDRPTPRRPKRKKPRASKPIQPEEPGHGGNDSSSTEGGWDHDAR